VLEFLARTYQHKPFHFTIRIGSACFSGCLGYVYFKQVISYNLLTLEKFKEDKKVFGKT